MVYDNLSEMCLCKFIDQNAKLQNYKVCFTQPSQCKYYKDKNPTTTKVFKQQQRLEHRMALIHTKISYQTISVFAMPNSCNHKLYVEYVTHSWLFVHCTNCYCPTCESDTSSNIFKKHLIPDKYNTLYTTNINFILAKSLVKLLIKWIHVMLNATTAPCHLRDEGLITYINTTYGLCGIDTCSRALRWQQQNINQTSNS